MSAGTCKTQTLFAGSSEDESVVDSDEAEGSEEYSGEEDLDEEEEGLSWDELEEEAKRFAFLSFITWRHLSDSMKWGMLR